MITVEWANEAKTAVNCRLSEGWTWEEFYAAQDEVNALIESVSWVVDTIFVPEASGQLPPNTLTHLRNTSNRRHERYGSSYMIASHTYMKVLLNALGRIISDDHVIHFAATQEEALTLIEQAQQKRSSQLPV